MNLPTRYLALAAVALLGGCVNNARPPATVGQGELILICELAPDVNELAVVPAANVLAKMPDVLDVTAATGFVSQTPNLNAFEQRLGRRVTFVLTFRSTEAAIRTGKEWMIALTDAGYMEKINRVIESAGTRQNYLISETFTQETTAADLQRRSTAAKDFELQRSRAK